MLTPTTINRHVASKRFSQLLDGMMANGLYLPARVQGELRDSQAGVVALGLRRVMELSHRPTAEQEQLVRWLLEDQAEDGSFESDPLVTALAASALASVIKGRQPADLVPEVTVAHERALSALKGMQGEHGLFGPPAPEPPEPPEPPELPEAPEVAQNSRLVVNAAILQALARDESACQMLGLVELLGWFEARHQQLGRDIQGCLRIARASLSRALAA